MRLILFYDPDEGETYEDAFRVANEIDNQIDYPEVTSVSVEADD